MEKVLHVTVLTPFGTYLKTDAEFLSVTSSSSRLGIMPNHAPLITTLEICKLVIKVNGKNEIFAIGGGVLNIKKGSNVLLLLDSIERKNEIDIARAIKAKQKAEELLLKKENVDISRAKASLARALNRISVVNEQDN